MIIMLCAVLLTGCTSSREIKSFSVGTNSRGMLEGDFDLVEIDTTTKITDEVDSDIEAENSLIDNSSTNNGASFEDDEDANNFYNQPTTNKSKEPLDDDEDNNSNKKSSKNANVNSNSSQIVPQVK